MRIKDYFKKMRGNHHAGPPRSSYKEILWSWLGALFGISLLAWVNHFLFEGTDLTLMIGSFGASAVLVYGAIHSPLAQPRNLLGGHIISAIIGVVCWKLLHQYPWLAEAMAVATAIAFMHLTKTLHPPGGATALIAVIGSNEIHQLGFWYVLIPAALGAIILLFSALLINNIPASRHYPDHWF